MKRILLKRLILSFSLLASLQSLAAASDEGSVDWYQPAFSLPVQSQMKSQMKSNRIRTVLSGFTAPGSRIFIASETVPVVVAGDKVKLAKTKGLLVNGEEVVANANGYFEWALDLPFGIVQLPVKVVAEGHPDKFYQVNLEANRNQVAIQGVGGLKASPALSNGAYVWGGIGFNYLRLTEASPESRTNFNFGSFKGPSYFIEGFEPFSPEWGLLGSIKRSPGSVTSSSTIKVAEGAYNWDIYTFEGRYSPQRWRINWNKKPGRVHARLGVNYHLFPYLSRLSTTEVEIKKNGVTMASIGGQFDYDMSRYWILTSVGRLQYPIMPGDPAIKAKLSFDGSVGIYYRFASGLNLGAFAYGQWHDFTYRLKDSVSGNEVATSESVLFSNVEIHAGYFF